MIRQIAFAACSVFVLSGTSHALSIESGDAGQAYQFHTKRATFTLANDEKTEAKGIKIKPLRPLDRVVSAPTRLAPGESAQIEVEVNAATDFGTRLHMFLIEADNAKGPTVARVRLYGLSVVENPLREIDFGQVKAGDTPNKTYELVSDDPALRIVDVIETSDFISAKVGDDGRGVVVQHAEKTPVWGKLAGFVRVRLNSPLQRELEIPVLSDARGDVVPSSSIFELGLIRAGGQSDFILQYRHVGDKAFKLTEPKLEGVQGTALVQNCIGAEKGCQQVRFVVDDKQTKGQLKGVLSVRLPEYDREIRVPVGGMLIAKDTQVGDLNDLLAASKNAETGKADLSKALKSMKAAEQPIPAPTPPGSGPLLRWSVSNESSIYGYAIHRSESENGRFQQQGAIVRRSQIAKDGIPSNYAVRDTEAVAGKDYWYRISTLYSDGKREFLTPPQHVKAAAADASVDTNKQ